MTCVTLVGSDRRGAAGEEWQVGSDVCNVGGKRQVRRGRWGVTGEERQVRSGRWGVAGGE